MEKTISIYTLVPICLTIIQLLLIIFVTYFILRKTGLCSKPIADIYENQGILSATITLGVSIIASADIESIFQSYKVYRQYSPAFNHDLLQKFSQLFLITLAVCLLFIIIVLSLLRLFAGPIDEKRLPSIGVPFLIFVAAIGVGTSITAWFISKELCDSLTPQLFNFK